MGILPYIWSNVYNSLYLYMLIYPWRNVIFQPDDHMSPHVFQLHQVGPDLGGVPGEDGEGDFFVGMHWRWLIQRSRSFLDFKMERMKGWFFFGF